MNKIQEDIPLFPLSGTILLPGANLPLNIFEERYIDMVNYALSKNKLIGIIQPSPKKEELFKIGCSGKITSFHETNDGRYIINLKGLRHFKIISEIYTENKFRIFKINYESQLNDNYILNENNFDKSLLIEKFKIYFKKTDPEIEFNSFDEIGSNELVKLIAMSCPFNSNEKQMLLESKDLNILASNLMSLFEYYINRDDSVETIN